MQFPPVQWARWFLSLLPYLRAGGHILMTLSQVPQGEQDGALAEDQPLDFGADTQAAGATPVSPEGSTVTNLLIGGQFTQMWFLWVPGTFPKALPIRFSVFPPSALINPVLGQWK